MFPVVLVKDLDKAYYTAKWQKQFVQPGRRRAEGLWRRTQEVATREKSGWQGPADARRRMIHFLDEYAMVENGQGSVDFAITATYLWMALTLPSEECAAYEARVHGALTANNWQQLAENSYQKAELQLTISRYDQHPEDIKAGRTLPAGYRTVEYRLVTAGMRLEERVIDSPWLVLNTGIRKQGTRVDEPTIAIDVSVLKDYFLIQFELGGGASIELGIPPLNHLHRTYNVTRAEDGAFVFGEDNFLTDLIANPVAFTKGLASPTRRAFWPSPTNFTGSCASYMTKDWQSVTP